jgi:hypothetical protein
MSSSRHRHAAAAKVARKPLLPLPAAVGVPTTTDCRIIIICGIGGPRAAAALKQDDSTKAWGVPTLGGCSV